MGSITYSRSTCGSGRRHTWSAANASTFTRTSLYLYAGRAVGGRAVGPVGLSPERTFPVAGLPQQMVPGDRAVVRRGEFVRGHVGLHPMVQVADQTAIVGQAYRRGQKALGHAERHVHSRGLAPLGHDVALPHDDTGHVPAGLERADSFAVWLAGPNNLVLQCQIAGGLGR